MEFHGTALLDVLTIASSSAYGRQTPFILGISATDLLEARSGIPVTHAMQARTPQSPLKELAWPTPKHGEIPGPSFLKRWTFIEGLLFLGIVLLLLSHLVQARRSIL